MAKFAAGWAWAAYQIGLCWMLAAPIVAGPHTHGASTAQLPSALCVARRGQ